MNLGKIASHAMELPARFLMLLIRFYRKCISPLKPQCCRFVPSCSEYALQAVRMHGAVRGMLLATWRIMRCHPLWHGDMYDPVPRSFAGSVYYGDKTGEHDKENSMVEKVDGQQQGQI